MAITRTASVLRFGAVNDQYKVAMDSINGQGSNAFHEIMDGFVFNAAAAAGTFTLTELADGSGGSIAEVYLKSNMSLGLGPELRTPFKGGLKFSGPAGGTALVYLREDPA